MRILRRKTEDCPVTRWAGGTTAELLLWPPEGSYAARDFRFRLSSATVEREESVFTPLPGVERWITPLRGGFELAHDGHGASRLAPYEIARFSGAWNTVCTGRATDFNLMLKGCAGAQRAGFGTAEFLCAELFAACLFFPEGGAARAGGETLTAAPGELFALFFEEGERVPLTVDAPVVLIANILQFPRESEHI